MFERVAQYAKFIAALIGAVLTSVSAVLPEVPLWLTISLAVASAVAVFAVPNSLTESQLVAVGKHVRENGIDG